MALSILHLRQPATDGVPGVPPQLARPSSSTTSRRRRLTLRPHHYALGLLLALTALAYIWDLTSSGYANSFYAAAVQAGTKSWKAFLFGSLDASNFITVDKPPASLWVMELSGRIFGFSSASMLVPEVLEGVAAVALVYAATKRWFGAWAGIAAGAVLAVTPVAALMFRFNNPDALLVLLLVAGAYCLVRALERGATRWILAAGAMIGFAFLAKLLQAFIVLPGFAAVYLLAAPGPLRRRVWQVLASGAAVIVSCGWWLLLVSVWPAADRPMIDGSPTNNIFNLIFGYNGLDRIFGGASKGGSGGGIGTSFGGSTGILRLFGSMMGSQASWLIPAALIALVVGVAARGRAPRTDRTRAALLLWGSWLVITGLVFSFSSGIIHTYYTVALAPAIAALVAIGGWQAWQARDRWLTRVVVGVTVAVTAAWSCVLLSRASSFEPWLTPLIIVGAVLSIAALAVLSVTALAQRVRTSVRQIAVAAAVLGAVACLAGPVAYTIDTVTTAHTGSTPTAGPSTGSSGFGGLGGGRSGFASLSGKVGARPTGSGSGLPSAPGGGRAGSAFGGSHSDAGGAFGGSHSPTGGGFGGGSATLSTALKRALETDAGTYKWVAATSGSQSAAADELSTGGDPVMAIGGFSGEGGHIALSTFKSDVAKGEIHYFVVSGGGVGGGGFGGSSSSGSTTSAITTWVESHFTKQTIGGSTVYNLTLPKSAG
jgi:4-amino-4-deoxy-L-arabinose transferase-like glycosyltransferase